MQVDQIMTDTVITIQETATIGGALQLMEENDIRHIPVMRGSQLVGMISDRDIRGLGLSLVTDVESFDALRGRLGRTVSDVMTGSPITLDPSSDVSELVDLMVEEKIGAVPVVSGDTGELVGIVSTVDVLRALRDESEAA